ncbi:MAG: glycosyl transferase family 1, partial [Saprospiraceae bacterium]|nr:glycosyl transferase family 1 [Saprospiraceae bacterium]
MKPVLKIYLISPAHPLRGGIASSSERLAQELSRQGHQVTVISYSLQYPGFLFPGKTQYTTDPAPQGVQIRTLINAVNPL